MNERIWKLAEQAGFVNGHQDQNGNSLSDEIEKLAQLIVKECSNLDFYRTGEVTHDGAETIGNMILEHFGVK